MERAFQGGVRRWLGPLAESSGGPVGLRLREWGMGSVGFLGWDDAGFFDAFHLGDASFVDGDLDGAVAEVAHAVADDVLPNGGG